MQQSHVTATNNVQGLSTSARDQYVPWQIVGIWLAAGATMWLLGWIVYPAMRIGLSPVNDGLLRIKLLTFGLIWQFVLAMIILYFEEVNTRLNTISRRFWLNHPVSARMGETRKSLWWWIVLLTLLVAFVEIGFKSTFVNLWGIIYPLFAKPTGHDMFSMFTPELRAQMIGAWSLFGSFFVNQLFNIILGEEFLFRGVLLPKMEGVFGKWDWVANGVIFGFYHLHQPWDILSSVMIGIIYAFSGKHFHSNWFPIILHSGHGVFLLILILGIISGMG